MRLTIIVPPLRKKIILHSTGGHKKIEYGINDEIGYINEQNIFIPEFVLYYKEKINISTLNSFFKGKFNKSSEQEKEPIIFYDSKNSIIGYCYSLANKNEKDNKQEDKK